MANVMQKDMAVLCVIFITMTSQSGNKQHSLSGRSTWLGCDKALGESRSQAMERYSSL
jgi:hypothetical protein